MCLDREHCRFVSAKTRGIIPLKRTIKRYSNRKHYDTANGRYVTPAQLAAIIHAGGDIWVIEHDSGRDLTAAMMAQIVFEEEKGGPRIGPAALRGLIRTGRLPWRSGQAWS